MGHKVHPIGFRLGVIKGWQSRWYSDKQYTELLHEDLKVRAHIMRRMRDAGIPRVEIDRAAQQLAVTIFTAKPGIVIGKGGQKVDELKNQLEKLTGKKVRLTIQEIRQPELDAQLVSESIADQIQRRVAYKRAIKQAIARAMQRGAQGIKIVAAGRLAGSEMKRRETERAGRVPLQTLRADIDYGAAEAHTTFGRIGVKVWLYRGEVLPERERPTPARRQNAGGGSPAGAGQPTQEPVGV